MGRLEGGLRTGHKSRTGLAAKARWSVWGMSQAERVTEEPRVVFIAAHCVPKSRQDVGGLALLQRLDLWHFC